MPMRRFGATIAWMGGVALALALTACAQNGPHADALPPSRAGCGIPAAGDGWAVGTPESVGIDSAILCPAIDRVTAFKEANVHAVLVARHGTLVFEHYFTGADVKWGEPLGDVTYDASMKHDLRSITKSVVALVVGIALDKGWIKSVDESVLSFFPEYADLRTPEKDKITVRDLLTMSQGLVWDEDMPYSNPANSETQMDRAADPYRYVLSRPVARPAGQAYTYSGGSAMLLAGILKKTTGKPLDQLARSELFEPLGISDVEWIRLPNGDPAAASGLRLRPRDLAKLGRLILARGRWNDRQIVSAAWIDAATRPQINGQLLWFYGYQFWLGRSLVGGREIDWVAAVGYGGQRLFIIPSLDLEVVVNCGLYASDMQAWVPVSLLNRFVLAAVTPHP